MNIKDVFSLSKKLGKQSFSEIVEISCGYKIIPVDLSDRQDKELIDFIKKAMNNFVSYANRSDARYKGNRANDVGKKMENGIIEEMKKTPLKPTPLGSSGYPDLYVEHNSQKVYIELKTSGQKKKSETHHRLFYFTSGKKISCNAHHLLLQIQIEEESPKYWKVESWQLRDLTKLKVQLKTEWNANNADFDKSELLGSG